MDTLYNSLSPEEKEKYALKGQLMYNTIDFETSTPVRHELDPMSGKGIFLAVKSGLSIKNLSAEERILLDDYKLLNNQMDKPT